MTDEDVNKLVSKLSKSLATKEDIREVKVDIQRLETRLGKKMDELNVKADTIMEFAEAVDETTSDHEKRLKRIEAVPVIAHQIKN